MLLALPALPAAAHANDGLTAQVCDVTGYVKANPDGTSQFVPDPLSLVANGFGCVGVSDTVGSGTNLVATAKGCVSLTVACISTIPSSADTLLNVIPGQNPCPNPGQENDFSGLCGLAGGRSTATHSANMSDLASAPAVVNQWNCTNGGTTGGRVGLVVVVNFTMNCDGPQNSSSGSASVSFDAHGYSLTAFIFDLLNLAPGCNIAEGTTCGYIAGVAMFSTEYCPPANVDLPNNNSAHRIRVVGDPAAGAC